MQKKVVKKVLFLSLFGVVFLCSGCLSSLPKNQSDIVNLQKEIQEHGIIQQPDLHSYLKSRLLLIDPNQSSKVIVLNDAHPRAFSTPREIVITSGLIGMATHPSQLDFIMAHELGHILHKHNQSTLSRFKLEQDADEFAAKQLAQRRMLCKEVLSLFNSNNQYSLNASVTNNGSYPSAEDRISVISTYISPCVTSYTDEKLFQKIRKILIDSQS
jgi:Zn-dependent protease with chaperone function